MSLLETWREALPASFTTFGALATRPQEITPILIAAAVLWPLGAFAPQDAFTVLHPFSGDQTQALLDLITADNPTPQGLLRQLDQLLVGAPDLNPILGSLIYHFDAVRQFTPSVVQRFQAPDASATYNFEGAINAALANFGGSMTIEQLTIANRSDAEELDSFMHDAVAGYKQFLYEQRDMQPSDPYKFLYSFDFGDQSIFFGRDAAVDSLLDQVLKTRLTVVHAPSGAGKTSVFRAGLSHRLLRHRQGYLPLVVRPSDDLLASIINYLGSFGSPVHPHLLKSLSLRSCLQYICKHKGSRIREVVIIIDQCEELFTLTAPERSLQTQKALVESIEDPNLPIRFVLGIRKEYFSDLAVFQPYLPHIYTSTFHLTSLNERELKDAILGPIRSVQSNIIYDDAVLDELIRVLSSDHMDLPELQILCTSLYQQAQSQAILHITYDVLCEIGVVQFDHTKHGLTNTNGAATMEMPNHPSQGDSVHGQYTSCRHCDVYLCPRGRLVSSAPAAIHRPRPASGPERQRNRHHPADHGCAPLSE